jgi:hypothetical protein
VVLDGVAPGDGLDAAQGCGMTIKQLSDMLSKMGGK